MQAPRIRLAATIAALAAGALVTGCARTGEEDDLRARVAALEARNSILTAQTEALYAWADSMSVVAQSWWQYRICPSGHCDQVLPPPPKPPRP